MRNPGGKEFSRGHRVCFRKKRRDRRAAEKHRLKSAWAKEGPPPWSPKESPSPPGPGLQPKLGVGKFLVVSLKMKESRGKNQGVGLEVSPFAFNKTAQTGKFSKIGIDEQAFLHLFFKMPSTIIAQTFISQLVFMVELKLFFGNYLYGWEGYRISFWQDILVQNNAISTCQS
jgi:hypothetical protein